MHFNIGNSKILKSFQDPKGKMVEIDTVTAFSETFTEITVPRTGHSSLCQEALSMKSHKGKARWETYLSISEKKYTSLVAKLTVITLWPNIRRFINIISPFSSALRTFE